MKNKVLLQGNEACVEGALAAGMRFFGGYPITPSTEIAEQAAVRLPMVGGKFIQMEDEIAAMATVIGASAVGIKSMTATSGPGFSLKQENIGYACLTEIPCVIVDVQRSGPSTGLPTSPSQGDMMQARWGTHGDHPVIAISPSTVSETYALTIRAFNLAEKYRTPVLLMMDEIVGHLREGIVIPEPSEIEVINRSVSADEEKLPPYAVRAGELVPAAMPLGNGRRYNITGLVHNDSGFPTNSHDVTKKLVTRLMDKIENNKNDIITYEKRNIEGADVVVFCYGGTMRSVLGAMEMAAAKGIKVGMFRPITVWPFPEEQIREITKTAKHIIVVEHNYGQLLHEVDRLKSPNCKLHFVGKIDGTVITPDEVMAAIEKARS